MGGDERERGRGKADRKKGREGTCVCVCVRTRMCKGRETEREEEGWGEGRDKNQFISQFGKGVGLEAGQDCHPGASCIWQSNQLQERQFLQCNRNTVCLTGLL